MSGQRVYLNGAPTEPDVRAIIEAFPVEKMVPGFSVAYTEIAAVIKNGVHTSRFRTVTTAWRKRLSREHNIEVSAVAGIGFVVNDNSQRISNSTMKLKSGFRRISRAGDLAARTSESDLTEEQKKTRNFTILLSGSVRTIAQTERKKLRYELATTTAAN